MDGSGARPRRSLDSRIADLQTELEAAVAEEREALARLELAYRRRRELQAELTERRRGLAGPEASAPQPGVRPSRRRDYHALADARTA